MESYEVVIVGGGAAGLSAGLVLARARRTVAVIDGGQPRNGPAARMQGFLSRDGLPPGELLELGWREVSGYGGDRIDGVVTSVRATGTAGFGVELDGRVVNARRVLLTTGLRDALPDIPGVADRWGRDVLHCPYCHGYEVRDQRLAVLGGTPDAVDHAQLVRQWSADVVYFPHTDTLTADQREQLVARAIGVVDGDVARLLVDGDRLQAVELVDGRTVARDAVFVRPLLVPNHQLLVGLGCAVSDSGWVTSDSTGRTTVPGVWVAGNAGDPRAQVITAAGQGSAAAIAINADLVEEDVRIAVRSFRLGLPA